VKKTTVVAAAFVLIIGLLWVWVPNSSLGQTPSTNIPHKIALIDMASVFKNYKKFEALREELKGDLTKSEEAFKAGADKVRQLQSEQKGYKEGSEEYSRIEKDIVTKTTQLEAYRKTKQRDLIRREAQIYKTIYLEVSDAVQKYAAHYNYTLVLRFSTDEVDKSDNPEEVMRGLNRQVVYYRPNDDITNTIVKYLNGKYEQAAARANDAAAPSRN